MKRTIIQASFEQGMLEVLRGDLAQNSGQMAVVKLLENFDHTVQQGGLVKRGGMRNVIVLDNQIATHSDYGEQLVGNINYNQDKNYVEYSSGEFCSFWNTFLDVDTNEIMASTSFRDGRGQSQHLVIWTAVRWWSETLETFIEGQQNGTMPVVWLQERGQLAPLWINPFVNSFHESIHPFPGWMARGVYTDHARYGSSIVFTTELNTLVEPYDEATYRTTVTIPSSAPDVATNLFPCYHWTLWDISSKRDRSTQDFWNMMPLAGLSESLPLEDLVALYDSDNKYATYKTLVPSMWVLRNEFFGVRELDSPNEVLAGSLAFDVEFCVGEFTLRSANTYPAEDWFSDGDSNEAVYRPDQYPMLENYASAGINKDLAFTESLETPMEIEPVIDPKHGQYTEWSDPDPNKALKEFKQRTFTANYDGREYQLTAIGSAMSSISPKHDGDLFENKMYAPNDERSPNWGKRGYMVLPLRLPNYLENGTPRYWMKGEKIPFVVTAVVNGIELMIAEHTYEVQNDHYQPNPNLFNVSANTSLEWYVDPGGGYNEPNNPTSYSALTWFHAHRTGTDSTAWRQSSLSRLFYGVYESDITTEGRRIFPLPVIAVPGIGITYDPLFPTIALSDKPLPEWVAHAWEPFNPSQHEPWTNTLIEPSPSNRFYVNHGDTGNAIGYRPMLTQPNVIWTALRIRASAIGRLVDMGLQKVNVYIAKSDPSRSRLRSIGLFSITKEIPATYYGLPQTEYWQENPTEYGLLRSFVLDGQTEAFADVENYQDWKLFYRGEPLQRNSWLFAGDRIVSWPQNKDGNPYTLDLPPALSALAMTPEDFVWDYATAAPTLTIGSTQYWHGRSARCIEQVKGRIFLGGCRDEKGEEENGIVRYSLVQNGVISRDVFVKPDYLQFGANPVVALKEFREQLWVWSRSEMYRLQMPSVTVVDSWEILEKVTGQGTFGPKTVLAVPYGVLWANESGLWLSTGTAPRNLAEGILPSWQWYASGTPSPLMIQTQSDEIVFERGFNPWMQLDYDSVRDVVEVSTPVFDEGVEIGMVIMVYEFQRTTWRIERRMYPEFGGPISRENSLF